MEPIISGSPGANLLLLCNAPYPAQQNALNSMANISWSTEIDGVDISNQSIVRKEEVIVSELLLTDVNFRFCGVYSCSATDRFTQLPSTTSTYVEINTGNVEFSCKYNNMKGENIVTCHKKFGPPQKTPFSKHF